MYAATLGKMVLVIIVFCIVHTLDLRRVARDTENIQLKDEVIHLELMIEFHDFWGEQYNG